ncbi:MAG: hypothetical protein VB099_09850 [Candidatus Limiplasma sp.]|nr:hypothetical protein [Candidatus Limiplasma sp.]
MSKVLFYAMTGEKVCLLHVLMNAVDLFQKGDEVRIIFEGKFVIWPVQLQEEKNPLYSKALEGGLIAGVCLTCAKQFEVQEKIEALGLPLIGDMFGHAAMSPYVARGYQVVSI